MVVMLLRFTVDPLNRAEIVKIIRPIVNPIEAQPGCLLFQLYSETDNGDALLLLQKWRSQEDLDKFIRSRDFKRILAVMDLANKPPEISFNAISSEAGMEIIEKLRLTSEAT